MLSRDLAHLAFATDKDDIPDKPAYQEFLISRRALPQTAVKISRALIFASHFNRTLYRCKKPFAFGGQFRRTRCTKLIDELGFLVYIDRRDILILVEIEIKNFAHRRRQ